MKIRRVLGILGVADALWMVRSPRKWQKFWSNFARGLRHSDKLRVGLAVLQAALGAGLLLERRRAV